MKQSTAATKHCNTSPCLHAASPTTPTVPPRTHAHHIDAPLSIRTYKNATLLRNCLRNMYNTTHKAMSNVCKNHKDKHTSSHDPHDAHVHRGICAGDQSYRHRGGRGIRVTKTPEPLKRCEYESAHACKREAHAVLCSLLVRYRPRPHWRIGCAKQGAPNARLCRPPALCQEEPLVQPQPLSENTPTSTI